MESMKEEYIATIFSDYNDINPQETRELSEHQYLLCSPHMFGFILKDRSYGEHVQLSLAERRHSKCF
jgi:hypothetical protein